MPSRSEGWGGAEREPDRAKHQDLFKDEQYRLNQTAGGEARPVRVWMILTVVINRYCSSLSRPPRLRYAKAPRLTQAGNGLFSRRTVGQQALSPRPHYFFNSSTRSRNAFSDESISALYPAGSIKGFDSPFSRR